MEVLRGGTLSGSCTCGFLKHSVCPTAATIRAVSLEVDVVLRLLPHCRCLPHGPAYSVDRRQTPS